jgi:putative endonuclease
MENCCYIIFSETQGKFYIGACHDDLELRIENHNNHSYGKHRFTSTATDWKLFIKIIASDYSQAIRIERKIKSMKSSKYINNLKVYPELIDKIYQETSN